jgi:DNA-binding response OmpR family regulator
MPKQQKRKRTIEIDGKVVELSEREYGIYQILEARAREGADPIPAEELEALVTDEVLEDNPGHWARIYIQRLREAFRAHGISPMKIQNTYGAGYWLWTTGADELGQRPRRRSVAQRPRGRI